MGKKTGHGDTDLATAALSDAEVQAILRDGEPPLVDVDALDYTRRLVYERQERVLAGFVLFGTVLKAAEYAEVDRDCVYIWRKKYSLNWNARWQMAVEHRRDYAENKYILHRLDNPKGNYGTDIAAIAYMNATWPEKWNRSVKVAVDVPNELIQQLRALQELGKQEKQDQALPAPKVVDGKAEVLPWE